MKNHPKKKGRQYFILPLYLGRFFETDVAFLKYLSWTPMYAANEKIRIIFV